VHGSTYSGPPVAPNVEIAESLNSLLSPALDASYSSMIFWVTKREGLRVFVVGKIRAAEIPRLTYSLPPARRLCFGDGIGASDGRQLVSFAGSAGYHGSTPSCSTEEHVLVRPG